MTTGGCQTPSGCLRVYWSCQRSFFAVGEVERSLCVDGERGIAVVGANGLGIAPGGLIFRVIGPAIEKITMVGADQDMQSAVAVEGDGGATVVVDTLAKRQGANQLAGFDIAYAQSDPGCASPGRGGVQPPHKKPMPPPDYLAADIVCRAAV
jgi:hypothetical protein